MRTSNCLLRVRFKIYEGLGGNLVDALAPVFSQGPSDGSIKKTRGDYENQISFYSVPAIGFYSPPASVFIGPHAFVFTVHMHWYGRKYLNESFGPGGPKL